MPSKMRNTVLVVEDDFASMQYLLLLLKKLECEVYSAETGEEALELMKDGRSVDIMLLDIALGAGINGIELGYKLKQDELHHETPMVAVTAFSEDKRRQMERAGFNDCLSKPYTIDELKNMLKKYNICPRTLS